MKRLNSGMNGSADEPLQLRQLNELKRRHYGRSDEGDPL